MADQARPQWSCAYCGRCFATQKAIRNHIETERLRIGDLIEQLRIAFLHSTSPYSTHTTEDSHDETVGDSDGSVPDNQSSKHESIDQSNKGDRLRCPFPSCNGEETYTKKTNMFRHYQTHIECNEKCAFCKKPFNRLRKLVKHLEDCKVKKNQDRQGIWPSQTQYLALRRKDRLCKSALEQMEQQMDQKTRSKGVRKRRKDSTPTETASYVGDDDDSSAEEHPAIPTEQMLPTQTHLSVRKRRRTEGTTSSKDGQHTSYRRNFSELEMLLAAAESSARSPVNENGNLDGPSVYPAIANTRGSLCVHYPMYGPPGHGQVASQYTIPAHAGVPVPYHTMDESPNYSGLSSQRTATVYGNSSALPYNTINNNYANLNLEEVNTPFVSTPGHPSTETAEISQGIFVAC